MGEVKRLRQFWELLAPAALLPVVILCIIVGMSLTVWEWWKKGRDV